MGDGLPTKEPIVEKSFYSKEGPWGGSDASQWIDGAYSRIESLTVSYGDIINSIQVEYHLSGENAPLSIIGSQHGGEGTMATKIVLTGDEYLKGIEGYVENFENKKIITSLTFITNRRKFGPYGLKIGKNFKSSDQKRIVGFYGRADTHLEELGIYTLETKMI